MRLFSRLALAALLAGCGEQAESPVTHADFQKDLQTRLIRERDQSEQRAAAADLVSSDLRRQVGTLERTLRDSRELVETYQRLAVVRFRDALLRAPLLGRAVRPVVRALGRMI